MNWHYAVNQEQRGPVSDAEFQGLVQQGVITPETLVWREGMPGWVPYEASSPTMPSLTAAPAGSMLNCAWCRRPTPQSDLVEIGGALYCAACKPLALHRLMGGVDLKSPADDTRQLHIKHEASIKSVGILYYLAGVAMLLVGAATVIGGVKSEAKEGVILGPVFAGLAILYFFVGAGVRRLRPWARVASGVLSGIGLLGFPIGTIINAYILYLLFSKKGATVFSPEYQDIIRQTPHIKYKTSVVVWVFLGLVLFLLVALIAAGIFSKH